MRRRTLRRRLFWLALALGLVLLALGGWIVQGLRTAFRAPAALGGGGQVTVCYLASASRRRKTTQALWPPKPKEFESETSISASRASFGM